MSDFSLGITWVICNNSPKYRNGFVLNAEVLTNQRNSSSVPQETGRGKEGESLTVVFVPGVNRFKKSPLPQAIPKDSDEAQL